MKFSKVAAVVAGSVAALGAVTPAFAADDMQPMSLNGGAMDAVAATAPLSENLPLHLENALEEQGSALHSTVEAAEGVNHLRNHAPDKVLGALTSATETAPVAPQLLGGLNINHG
ncbi:hypothetical protein ACIQUQ_13870 [Streptomyces sp. NPDC101118]|uniref:hypothetical protein n=1 Tax=Streptomyces sp. NPDC101118 TaxID=3366109 RepID=UPI0037FA30D6